MTLHTLYVDSADRTRRAEVFASAATDTFIFIDHWHAWRIVVVGIHWNHSDGAGWTFALAVAAAHFVGQNHAQLFVPHRRTNFYRRLIFHCYWLDGAGGADLRTDVTLWATETALIRHLGLQHR